MLQGKHGLKPVPPSKVGLESALVRPRAKALIFREFSYHRPGAQVLSKHGSVDRSLLLKLGHYFLNGGA